MQQFLIQKSRAFVKTCHFTKKADLASLKADAEGLDVDKFKTVPIYLKKLSDLDDINVLKISKYNQKSRL